MILTPPSNSEPDPVDDRVQFTKEQVELVVSYLNVSPWKCPKCGCMNFGRNKYCPANRNGECCRTVRPE